MLKWDVVPHCIPVSVCFDAIASTQARMSVRSMDRPAVPMKSESPDRRPRAVRIVLFKCTGPDSTTAGRADLEWAGPNLVTTSDPKPNQHPVSLDTKQNTAHGVWMVGIARECVRDGPK